MAMMLLMLESVSLCCEIWDWFNGSLPLTTADLDTNDSRYPRVHFKTRKNYHINEFIPLWYHLIIANKVQDFSPSAVHTRLWDLDLLKKGFNIVANEQEFESYAMTKKGSWWYYGIVINVNTFVKLLTLKVVINWSWFLSRYIPW